MSMFQRERGGIERKRSERQKVSLSRDCVGGEREGGRQQIDKLKDNSAREM